MELRIEKTQQRRSVFKDESTLSEKYLPLKLPQRKKYFVQLFHLFETILYCPGVFSRKVLLTGDAGVGKTTVAQLFGTEMQRWARERYDVNLKYVHIYCTPTITLLDILKLIISAINPNRSYKRNDVRAVTQHLAKVLEKENAYVLLCLDDAEPLYVKDSQMLYELMKVKEDSLNKDKRFAFLIIARSSEIKGNLPSWILPSCRTLTYFFKPYTPEQILEIIRERVKLAFVEGAVVEKSIQLIAELVQHSGDIRLVIDILKFAGVYANLLHSPKVEPDHVEWAYEEIHSEIDFLEIEELDWIKGLILVAIKNLFEQEARACITKDEIYNEFVRICEQYRVKVTRRTRIYQEIDLLQMMTGFIGNKERKVDRVRRKTSGGELVSLNIPFSKLKSIVTTHLNFDLVWKVIHSEIYQPLFKDRGK